VAIPKIEVPTVGYQPKGTLQGFQNSGSLFDTFTKTVEEMLNLDTKAVGVIRVEEVYSAALPSPGVKIA
jgi:hypothetical protein